MLLPHSAFPRPPLWLLDYFGLSSSYDCGSIVHRRHARYHDCIDNFLPSCCFLHRKPSTDFLQNVHVLSPNCKAVCVPNLGRRIGRLQCQFLPLHCTLPGLTDITQDFPAWPPANSHCLSLVSDAQFPFLGYGVMSAKHTVHELPEREMEEKFVETLYILCVPLPTNLLV